MSDYFDKQKLKELSERISYGIDITFDNFTNHYPETKHISRLSLLKGVLKDEILNHALCTYFKKEDNKKICNITNTETQTETPPTVTSETAPSFPETITHHHQTSYANSSPIVIENLSLDQHNHYYTNANNGNKKRKKYDGKKVCIYCKESMELDRYPTDKNIFWKCKKGCKNKNGRINKIFLDDLEKPKSKEYWLYHYIPNIEENEIQFKEWVFDMVNSKHCDNITQNKNKIIKTS